MSTGTTPSQSELDELARHLGDVAAPGVAAAVVTADGIFWQGSTGIARPSSGRAVDDETAFLWFSMTKIATATATMQLADSGELDLDAQARGYLPQMGSLDRRITIRHLLNHSSGIANPPPLRWIHPADEPGPKPREMVSRLLERYGKPKFKPGDHSAYTNIGYLVLGELIAEVSGVPYKEFVVERVLRPIGAASTGFTFEDSGAAHASEGTHPRRDPMLPLMRLLTPKWAVGPAVGRWRLFTPFYLDGSAYGGLVGPVGDAALFAAAHLGRGALDGRRMLSPKARSRCSGSSPRARNSTSAWGGFAATAIPNAVVPTSST